jgi:hypothetical protein
MTATQVRPENRLLSIFEVAALRGGSISATRKRVKADPSQSFLLSPNQRRWWLQDVLDEAERRGAERQARHATIAEKRAQKARAAR